MSVRRYEELIRGEAGDFQFLHQVPALPAAALVGLGLEGGATGIWLGLLVGISITSCLMVLRFWRLSAGSRTAHIQMNSR